jgi:regulator of cell morphogenesis and NO signaling
MQTVINENNLAPTLGQLAASDLRKAEVFKKYGLDFCCGGKKTVMQACTEKGLDAALVEQELSKADKNPATRPLPFNTWPLGFLADYIVNTHHSYVIQTLPELRAYTAKVAEAHGRRNPELLVIQQLVERINEEMSAHMVKEETIFFPYIKQLAAANISLQLVEDAPFGTVQQPINRMEMEHETVGQLLEEIRKESKGFKVPEGACASYNVLYRMLEEFEGDLHLHVHLENNILFPRALQIEKELKS